MPDCIPKEMLLVFRVRNGKKNLSKFLLSHYNVLISDLSDYDICERCDSRFSQIGCRQPQREEH